MVSLTAMTDASDRDPLTGLPGPDDARAHIAGWTGAAAARGEPAPLHVMLLGLGRFDTVNLAYGEIAGDGALVAVAQRIVHFAQDEFEDGEWFAARLGGGQFLLAACEECSRERWQWLGEALSDVVAHPIGDIAGGGTMRLLPRVALMRVLPGEGPAVILDRLAETLERARTQQGQRIVWADRTATVAGRHSAELEADLLAALDRDQIEILYQPQFALADDRLIGAEALARWQHPHLGRIGAGALFAIAERADHVAQLSRHIVERALAGARDWPEGLRLSVNAAPADLAAPDFGRELLRLVGESGFDPAQLTLEITEDTLIGDLEKSAATLARLREAGIRIALDDFGAGFCNFAYLKLLPLDYLKLDRSMVDGIAGDERDLAVLRGIVAMARALKLSVTVEGVEHEDQLAIVRGEACDAYQGFLRAAPMSADAFAELAR